MRNSTNRHHAAWPAEQHSPVPCNTVITTKHAHRIKCDFRQEQLYVQIRWKPFPGTYRVHS
jgi:hypothetical protein